MSWLIWREYRTNALLLVIGVGLLLMPYLFTLIYYAIWPGEARVVALQTALANAAAASYGLSQLAIAFLGGNAIAGERADRSAEFLSYLPISRTDRLLSKLLFAAIGIALIWGINLGIFRGLEGKFPWQVPSDRGLLDAKYTAITGLVMFGVAWCISSLQSSPTFAIAGGIVTPIAVMVMILTGIDRATEHSGQVLFDWYSGICITLGLAGLVVGTWYFLKRVEP